MGAQGAAATEDWSIGILWGESGHRVYILGRRTCGSGSDWFGGGLCGGRGRHRYHFIELRDHLVARQHVVVHDHARLERGGHLVIMWGTRMRLGARRVENGADISFEVLPSYHIGGA